MKYLVFAVPFSTMTKEFPVVFPDDLTHSEVAAGFLANCAELKNGRVVGAGECSCLDITPKCSGRSSTLNIDSRGDEDTASFIMRDYSAGLV